MAMLLYGEYEPFHPDCIHHTAGHVRLYHSGTISIRKRLLLVYWQWLMDYTSLQLQVLFLPRRLSHSRLCRLRLCSNSFLYAMVSSSFPEKQGHSDDAQDTDERTDDDCNMCAAARRPVVRPIG